MLLINSIRLRADTRSQLEVYELFIAAWDCAALFPAPGLLDADIVFVTMLHINLYSTMLTQPHKSKVDRTVNSQALSAPKVRSSHTLHASSYDLTRSQNIQNVPFMKQINKHLFHRIYAR